MNVRPERSNRAPLPGPEAPSPAEGPAGVDSAGLRRRFNRGGEVTPEERNARLLDAILRNLNVVSGPNERGEYIAWCPFHPDGQGKPPHQPNLHINPERGFICYACGAKGSIPTLARRLGIVEGVGTGQPDVVYPYRDEEGTVVFEVVRFPGKRFRQRRPDGNGGLIWNIKGVRRVLYRLPELLAADPSALVFIAEGENDADRLVQEGLLATTNPGGAGKWRPEFNEAFRGRDVVILADNDDPGREHAEKVAQALHGIARRVRVVEFPDLAPHGDVSDFLGRHSKQDLLARAEKTADWTPAAGENGEAAPHAQRAPYDLVRTVCIGQRAVRDSYPKPEFAIDGIMREKRVHELTAPFKTGKTNLACQTIVAMATGRKFLGRSVKRPYRVAILQNDMEASDMVEYMELALKGGGITEDLDNILAYGLDPEDEVRILLNADPGNPDASVLGRTVLEAKLKEDGVEILFIDSRNSTWHGRLNEDELGELVRYLIHTLRDRLAITVVILTHTPHADSTRSAGHHSWHAGVDIIWTLVPTKVSPEDPEFELRVTGRIPSTPPISFRRVRRSGGLWNELCPPAETAKQRMARAVAAQPGRTWTRQELKAVASADGEKVGKDTARNWVNEQLRRGYLEEVKDVGNNQYPPLRLTEKGREAFGIEEAWRHGPGDAVDAAVPDEGLTLFAKVD